MLLLILGTGEGDLSKTGALMSFWIVLLLLLVWSTDVGLQLARRLSHRVPRGQLLLAAPKDSQERYHKHNNNKYQRNRPRES